MGERNGPKESADTPDAALTLEFQPCLEAGCCVMEMCGWRMRDCQAAESQECGGLPSRRYDWQRIVLETLRVNAERFKGEMARGFV
jgi:hypothetical protein